MLKNYYQWLRLFIIKYVFWLFLFIIVCYNIFFPLCITDNIIYIFVLPDFSFYLPNYLQFNSFFNIENYLLGVNIIIYPDIIDYQILERSLEEIDYPLFGNGEGKPIKYIQWHQLPRWSVNDDVSWHNTYNTIMQTGQGNLTYDFERFFLKYFMGDPGFKDYMPVKYTSWRYSETFYIKFLLHEIKYLSMRMEGWKILRQYAGNRLCSKRKCSYLFRCYDTYLRLYFKYELVQCESWAYSFNRRVKWMIKEYYWRKPWMIGICCLIKALIAGFCVYKGWGYLP